MTDEKATAEVETAKTAKSATVAKVIETVKGMTVMELSTLVKALEEEFGVTAAAPVMAMAPGAGAAGAAPAKVEEEKTDFNVILACGRHEQDPGDQGRARAHRSRPEGSQGPGGVGSQRGEGRRAQGRSRKDQEGT